MPESFLDELFDHAIDQDGILGDALLEEDDEDEEDDPYYELATHAPVGGITIHGKFYKGGMFIPGKVVAEASDAQQKKLGVKPKTVAKVKGKSSRAVTAKPEKAAPTKPVHEKPEVEHLHDHLARYKRVQLSEGNLASAKRALAALKGHHKENVLDVIARKVGEDETALSETKDAEKKDFLKKRLAAYGKMLEWLPLTSHSAPKSEPLVQPSTPISTSSPPTVVKLSPEEHAGKWTTAGGVLLKDPKKLGKAIAAVALRIPDYYGNKRTEKPDMGIAHKVYIHDLWNALRKKHNFDDFSFNEFKAALLEANKTMLWLGRVDMVKDHVKNKASTIEEGNSSWQTVNTTPLLHGKNENGEPLDESQRPRGQPDNAETLQYGYTATDDLLRAFHIAEQASHHLAKNFVHLATLRKESGLPRDVFNKAIHELQQEGVLTLAAAEGRHGVTKEDREAGIQEPAMPGSSIGQLLLYASLKPGGEDRLKEALAKRTSTTVPTLSPVKKPANEF